ARTNPQVRIQMIRVLRERTPEAAVAYYTTRINAAFRGTGINATNADIRSALEALRTALNGGGNVASLETAVTNLENIVQVGSLIRGGAPAALASYRTRLGADISAMPSVGNVPGGLLRQLRDAITSGNVGQIVEIK